MTVTVTVTVSEEGFQRQPSCQDKQHLLLTARVQFHNLEQIIPGKDFKTEKKSYFALC